MRIRLVTAYYPPDTGSAAHIFHDLGNEFVAAGHDVDVLTLMPSYHAAGDLSPYEGKRWMTERAGRMSVHRVGVPSLARNTRLGRALWQFVVAVLLVVRGARLPKADTTLVYSPPLPLGLTAIALRGGKLVLNVQDLFPQSVVDLGLLKNKPAIRLLERLEAFIYRRSDAIAVHSAGNRNHVVGRGGAPATTVIVHNAVDTEAVCPGSKNNEFSRLHSLTDRFVVSFGGVLGHSQDLDVVLDAALRLTHLPDLTFLVAGEGVEKSRLVARVEALGLTNFIWLPMQPREIYPMLLWSSDVGLATLRPSVKTPVVPSKILSIMASGRPVVAALDLEGDAPRLIAESESGFAIEPGNSAALAEAIEQLYSDSDLRQKQGESGRQYAVNNLTTRAVALEYLAIFAGKKSHSSIAPQSVGGKVGAI